MTPAAMAGLHALCFDRPRPWSEAEFSALLADPAIIAATEDQGFALGRVVADEAEILTLAVDPVARRQGVATGLVRALAAAAGARGAATMFLEVAAQNAAARALYAGLGFVEVGRRRGYYASAVGPPDDALILRRATPGF